MSTMSASAKAGIGMLSVKRTDFVTTQPKSGGLKVYGHRLQRAPTNTRVPDVPALKILSDPVTKSPTMVQNKDQKDVKDPARDVKLLFSLSGTVDGEIDGAGKIKDIIVRMNIAIKILESKPSPLNYIARQLNKKLRRRADRIYEKLFASVIETQKVAFNLHQMMAEIKQNEWNLTEFEYNHLFHEIRDGSWTYEKVLNENETLQPAEDFRRHVLLLDVYCKVLLENVFKDCQFLLQSLVEEKKTSFILEFETLRVNILCLRGQYDYLRNRGHIPYECKPFPLWGARVTLPEGPGATVVCESLDDSSIIEELLALRKQFVQEHHNSVVSQVYEATQNSQNAHDTSDENTSIEDVIKGPKLCEFSEEDESDESDENTSIGDDVKGPKLRKFSEEDEPDEKNRSEQTVTHGDEECSDDECSYCIDKLCEQLTQKASALKTISLKLVNTKR